MSDKDGPDRVELYEADDGWRWRAWSSSDIIADSGQAYAERSGAIEGARDNYGKDVQITEEGMEQDAG
jgi:hypothetical protein